jgi:transcriptional regulator with XRE-family HTH domain
MKNIIKVKHYNNLMKINANNVLVLHYLEKHKLYDLIFTQQEVADILGITRSSVSQIEKRIKSKLRRNAEVIKFLDLKDTLNISNTYQNIDNLNPLTYLVYEKYEKIFNLIDDYKIKTLSELNTLIEIYLSDTNEIKNISDKIFKAELHEFYKRKVTQLSDEMKTYLHKTCDTKIDMKIDKRISTVINILQQSELLNISTTEINLHPDISKIKENNIYLKNILNKDLFSSVMYNLSERNLYDLHNLIENKNLTLKQFQDIKDLSYTLHLLKKEKKYIDDYSNTCTSFQKNRESLLDKYGILINRTVPFSHIVKINIQIDKKLTEAGYTTSEKTKFKKKLGIAKQNPKQDHVKQTLEELAYNEYRSKFDLLSYPEKYALQLQDESFNYSDLGLDIINNYQYYNINQMISEEQYNNIKNLDTFNKDNEYIKNRDIKEKNISIKAKLKSINFKYQISKLLNINEHDLFS